MGATEFKAHFLELIDEIKLSGKGILITKRGKPAAIVLPPPVDESQKFQIGKFDGTVKIVGDIIAPIDVEWDAMK
jgi:prevent-host-death family protein